MMKQDMAILMLGVTTLTSLACASPAFATDAITHTGGLQLPVTVDSYARHTGGKIVYLYRVINNSQQNITSVTVGRDNQNDGNPNNDVNELLELPSGWNAKLGIPSTSSNTPTGWRVSVLAPEDNEAHAIAWEAMNDRSPKILPGQTINKMSISLDKADNYYLTGHALVTYANGDPINLTVPLDQLDVTPPSLTVNLSPGSLISSSNKFIAINASFTIKDDYDRLPEIKLESITANEPLDAGDIRDASFGLDDRYFKLLGVSKGMGGRIYTVTYSATDASGNKTIASATLTVSAPGGTPAPEPAPSVAPHN